MKLIHRKFTHIIRNHQHVALGRSANQSTPGMSSIIKDLFFHKKIERSFFFRLMKLIHRKFTHIIRNHQHVALGRSANQSTPGMSSIIKDLFFHKKMVESSRGLNSVGRFYEQLLLICHSCVPWNIWQPQSCIEKVDNFVPYVRRQRFTRSLH